MGGVKDKYLKRDNAGDQYVGRCASCLDQLDKSFAMSPPYFDYSKLDETERVIMREKIKIWLKDRILEYHNVSACTRVLIDVLFVTICYHLCNGLQTDMFTILDPGENFPCQLWHSSSMTP